MASFRLTSFALRALLRPSLSSSLSKCGALLLRGAGCTVNDLLDRDIDAMPDIRSFVLVASLLLSSHEEPQAYLGLTFNWGILLGWSAIKGSLDPAIVLPLYFSGVLWTLVYDTIYAHQSGLLGLKYHCISSHALSGFNADIGWSYYAFLAAASGQLAWQIWTVNLTCRTDCHRKCVIGLSHLAAVLVNIS
ncbi:putative Alanyl-tRNA synthetase [Hibiscus syriacus]|uniref:Alanyl-tRNA synthetase n=1 Tax=Hibiscus syriacus TaxID=106335 RepID=A0A6A3BB06_HIBSY|nr:putative Alanyl-tRNA synthetase [Hibiscus syriacus]